jgi:hypothetical protein
MTRVVFSTGFEYCFTFDVQTIKDLEIFEGIEENGVWMWLDDDNTVISILNQLYKYEDLGFLIPKFYNYEKTMEGTELMYQNEKFGVPEMKCVNAQDISRFRLGCLIYHQLLYTNVLVGKVLY